MPNDAAAAAPPDPAVRDVPLSFRLGEITLFRLRLRLQVHQAPLWEEVTAEAWSLPPAPAPGTTGLLLRAHPVSAAMPVLARQDGWLRYAPLQYEHFYIDLRGGFEDYRARFSAKTRSTIGRKIRRFSEHCADDVLLSVHRTPAEIQAFLDRALPISRRTYQERLFGGGLPETKAFRDQALALAAENRVRGYLLRARGQAVAYMYCSITQAVASYDYVGYAPDFAKWSVGTVMFWQAMENLFSEDGIDFFDFTEGESEQKRLFSTHHRQCANVFFIDARWKNRLVINGHYVFHRGMSAMATKLDQWGIKTQIKRLLRVAVQR